jgi:hypothetical protein|tara:strand:- start:105 stop:1241 length:1137 start_codon:yes stop_codon:yes gene_type:complete
MYLKLAVSLALISWILLETSSQGIQVSLLFVIGCGLGISLYHASFGFAGAYRRLFEEKDMSGVTAQLVMLAIATILFAPVLAQGHAFDHGAVGAMAPVSLSMALGACLFGVGMQMGGACASGTLFTGGAGNPRMLLLLFFFCIGAFRGSLDLHWWNQLPGTESVSLGELLGWEIIVPLQLLLLTFIYLLMRWRGCREDRDSLMKNWIGWKRLLIGPWPLLHGAVALALLNWAVLVTAGHPWTITWGFTLWGAKLAVLTGWDPSTSSFWTGGFQQAALTNSLLADTTSLMNFGIMLGALAASALAKREQVAVEWRLRSTLAVVSAGLLMGYGARLAYGCNIGAFFSGVASGSLHGWIWIVCAMSGIYLTIKISRLLKID